MREQLALDEVKDIYKQLYAIGDTLDKKAMSLLASSSLILTLFSVLQINLGEKLQDNLYVAGVCAVFVLYSFLVISVLKIIAPKDYRTVFEHTAAAVNRTILNQEDDASAYLQLVVHYLARIDTNNTIDDAKRKWLFAGIILFIAIVFLILSLSLITIR